jgi:hypothetical protein
LEKNKRKKVKKGTKFKKSKKLIKRRGSEQKKTIKDIFIYPWKRP